MRESSVWSQAGRKCPRRRRASPRRFPTLAAAGLGVLAIGVGIFIGMKLESMRAGLAATHAGRARHAWPSADLTMWPTDSVSFKIPAEYSAQGTLVAVDPNSKHGSTRYWIDVVVSNDGTFRIEQIVPADSRQEERRTTMMSRRRFVGLLGRSPHSQPRLRQMTPPTPCPIALSFGVRRRSAQPTPNNVRLVTGSPYSALGISQTVTTLPDGNRIVRQNTIRQWRDSEAARVRNFRCRRSAARGRSRSTPRSRSSTIRKLASVTCCSPQTRWRSPCPSFPAT